MDRTRLLETLKSGECFDLLVIGGGATGCGVALDAASRGLSVALVEREDFACGTSGRSTKLVHGGVRYLEAALLHLDRVQFNLVKDALYERGVLLRIAPHLCRRLELVTPLYRWSEVPYIFAGLKLYDLLAAGMGIGPSRLIGPKETLRRFPMIREVGLKAGVLYYDGQFNDARMNLALALTAIDHGAAAVNHLEATGLIKEGGRLVGARVRERFSGESWEIRARCVVNATGPFADRVRLMDDLAVEKLLTVSSGVHIILDRRFTPPEAGITIPRTEDGRVLFILPWQGHCLVGTTDDPATPCEHPEPGEVELDYLLRHLERFFNIRVGRCDITAAWAGLRPLVKDPGKSDTAQLARDHVISTSRSGLVTICGGKWTTYRKMAQDTVDYTVQAAGLAPRLGCRTDRIFVRGGEGFRPDAAGTLAVSHHLSPETAQYLNDAYGDRAEEVAELCRNGFQEPLVSGHPYLKGEVLYAVRCEMALTAADFLTRRTSLAVLDRARAWEAAPAVLEIMARELGWDAKRVSEERRELEARIKGAL